MVQPAIDSLAVAEDFERAEKRCGKTRAGRDGDGDRAVGLLLEISRVVLLPEFSRRNLALGVPT